MPTVKCPHCDHEFTPAPAPRPGRCRAIKRTGAPCRQTKDLDADGYCQYHQTPKYKTPAPPADTGGPIIKELPSPPTPPPGPARTVVVPEYLIEEVED